MFPGGASSCHYFYSHLLYSSILNMLVERKQRTTPTAGAVFSLLLPSSALKQWLIVACDTRGSPVFASCIERFSVRGRRGILNNMGMPLLHVAGPDLFKAPYCGKASHPQSSCTSCKKRSALKSAAFLAGFIPQFPTFFTPPFLSPFLSPSIALHPVILLCTLEL